jgi:hypothetical protein
MYEVLGDCQVPVNTYCSMAVSPKRNGITLRFFQHYKMYMVPLGARGGVVVKALRHKPAGRGFDSRWCHWNISVT